MDDQLIVMPDGMIIQKERDFLSLPGYAAIIVVGRDHYLAMDPGPIPGMETPNQRNEP